MTNKLVAVDADVLCSLVERGCSFCGELLLESSPDSLVLGGMDKANVAMFRAELGSALFVEVLPSARLLLPDSASAVFAKVKPKSRAELSWSKASVALSVYSDKGGASRRECKLLDESQKPKLKEPSLRAASLEWVGSCSEFFAACKAAESAAESCRLRLKDGLLLVEAEGDLLWRTESLVGDSSSGEGFARYSLEYLCTLGEFFKAFETVKLLWSKDYPLRLEARSGALSVSAMLAPRVENA